MADVPGLRPSPDRVRETLFNWLAHLVPDFSTLRGLDLFAGTGALGLEFASRGAAEVTLVESHSALSARLRQVAAKLAATTVNVVAGDALVFARATPDRSFDVVFLDPPFDTNMLLPALREAARLVAEDGYIYAESGAELDPAALEDCRLQAVRTGRAGQVRFSLLQRA